SVHLPRCPPFPTRRSSDLAGDRRPVFPITITPGDNIILVNVQSTGEAVSFHPVLWDPVVFQQADVTNALTDGITYGLLLLLVLVSLCLSAVVRRGQLSLMAMSVFFYICLDAAQKKLLTEILVARRPLVRSLGSVLFCWPAFS